MEKFSPHMMLYIKKQLFSNLASLFMGSSVHANEYYRQKEWVLSKN